MKQSPGKPGMMALIDSSSFGIQNQKQFINFANIYLE